LNGWHCAFLCFLFKKFTAPPASLQIAHKTDCKSRTILFKNQGVSAKSFQLAIVGFQLRVKALLSSLQLRLFSQQLTLQVLYEKYLIVLYAVM